VDQEPEFRGGVIGSRMAATPTFLSHDLEPLATIDLPSETKSSEKSRGADSHSRLCLPNST
ncbi:MAG TPA: hypothetical protein VG099_01590, partial [Gemmataceae bacterium]|nr:hypothetical protein [Gemmataceae bacterium]